MIKQQSSRPTDDRRKGLAGLIGTGTVLLAVAVMALAAIRLTFRSYLDLVAVHGASCAPTLVDGEYLIALKLRKGSTSIPRGSIVLICSDGASMLKRVIGLPGDDILVRDGRVYINGSPLLESYLDPRMTWTRQRDWPARAYGSERTALAGYFVRGDNRDASADSRSIGPIPADDIAARVWLRIWPISRITCLN